MMCRFVVLLLVASATVRRTSTGSSCGAGKQNTVGIPRTRFCLYHMHSYVEIPMCDTSHMFPAHRYPQWEAAQPEAVRHQQYDTVERISGDLGCYCKNATGPGDALSADDWRVLSSGGALASEGMPDLEAEDAPQLFGDVHWNVPGAMHALQVDKVAVRSPCDPHNSGEAKEIAPSMPIHPICAWGAVNELSQRYSVGKRVGGDHGMGGVGSVAFRTPLQAAAMAGTVVGNVLKQVVDEKLIHRREGGVDLDALGQNIAVTAAGNIQWEDILNLDCHSARPSMALLSSKCLSAVCWNFVRDFHDLVCSLWTPDATAMGCSIESGTCCEAIAADHKGMFRGPQVYDHEYADKLSPFAPAFIRQRYTRLYNKWETMPMSVPFVRDQSKQHLKRELIEMWQDMKLRDEMMKGTMRELQETLGPSMLKTDVGYLDMVKFMNEKYIENHAFYEEEFGVTKWERDIIRDHAVHFQGLVNSTLKCLFGNCKIGK